MDAIRKIIIQVERLKQSKKFTEAIQTIQWALGKNSDDHRLYEELADIYLYNWDLSKAMRAINFALNLNEKSPTGNYLKGFILLSQDKVYEAIKYLEKSNNIMGNNAEVLRNIGWAYTMLGETERGIVILKRALNISPEDELITEDLAMALIGIGEIQQWNSLLKKIGKSGSTVQ